MKKLSIIIPVYNEEKTVKKLIEKVVSVSIPDFAKEIIVVNDGSTDQTKKLLREIKKKHAFIFLNHKDNLGKGAAIKSGLERVTGEYVLIQDADLEYNPEDYGKLLKKISKNGVDVVYGSRNLDNRLSKRGYFLYYLGGRFITLFMNLVVGTNLTDINTCYKLFSSEILKKLDIQSNGFEFCEEVTVKTHMLGYEIEEVPIYYNPRSFSDGKKIKFWNGFVSLWTIFKFRTQGGEIEK